jgi:hypothetical protein
LNLLPPHAVKQKLRGSAAVERRATKGGKIFVRLIWWSIRDRAYCSRMVIPGVTPEDASCIMKAFVAETM